MTSRRSNRGGHTKGNRKKDGVDNSGDLTRCVCNQQHHEGVMIQCETCKVWQHCSCVGLGNGEVTPDKYFCESCRPQNHPYSVINGTLTSNLKKVPHQSPPTTPATRVSPASSTMSYSSKTNPPKKRNTMNSKEASIPMDLMLAQQKWNDEHMDEILDDDIISRLSTKKRKKNGSATDAEDDGYSSDQTKEKDPVARPQVDIKNEYDLHSKDVEQMSPSSPTKAQDESGQTLKNKTVLKTNSRSNSPNTNTVPDGVPTDTPEEEERPISSADGNRQESTLASKRRKTGKSTSKEDEGLPDTLDHTGKALSPKDNDTNNVQSNIAAKSPLEEPLGKLKRGNIRQGFRVASPTAGVKKAVPRRGAERNSQRQSSSRHSTPALNSNIEDGTPQPMEPAAPAVVRYPSAKMTIHEMAKRARQLLDYISRIQIDMADRKNKGCFFPADQPSKSGTGATLSHAVTSGTTAPTVTTSTNSTEKTSGIQWTSMLPPTAVAMTSTVQPGLQDHDCHDHQDDGRVPDLSRTSMESALLHDIHSDHSHVGAPRPMPIKVEPMAKDGTSSPVLSTPPLSNHDRSSGHHRQEQAYGPSGSATEPIVSHDHEPLTPPHLAVGPFAVGSSSSDAPKADASRSMSSLEIMDKLTGDLIRFQEKYGSLH
ncbi:hypothetical protein EMPS_07848 [Entomortierella parvispora]|uniref:Zinc finger PHD-type domain-containing protein n=1 Tax=Entomortierella parvispora TaxID=205924 RepID=A0A9P3LZ27_9FUNG|nr:hypothetical protein EMPS_07848 [Entomortierella parvispora]